MNGCINDVGVKSLLAASTSLEDLRARVQKSCSDGHASCCSACEKVFRNPRCS